MKRRKPVTIRSYRARERRADLRLARQKAKAAWDPEREQCLRKWIQEAVEMALATSKRDQAREAAKVKKTRYLDDLMPWEEPTCDPDTGTVDAKLDAASMEKRLDSLTMRLLKLIVMDGLDVEAASLQCSLTKRTAERLLRGLPTRNPWNKSLK